MVPKAYRLLRSITCQFSCGQTGGCRRVDARFALAVWTLAFGPLAVETSVPSDACHPWHWSLSALVTVGAGWCERPLDQPSNPTLDESTGSATERNGSKFV
jgi:hypothetical protein